MQVTDNNKKHRGIFYGWWIVAASIIGLSTGPGQFAFGSMGLFYKPLELEFGWNRAEISLALTAFTVALIFFIPVAGTFVDRFGGRRVLIPSIIIVAFFLAMVPLLTTELWHFIVIFALMGSLGAGANSLPYMLAVSAWFDRHRGLAIGIVMAGGGLGYAYVPPLIQYVNTTHGWRTGYYTLTAITIFIALPLIVLLFRETPEQMGLNPDGDETARSDRATTTSIGMSRSQAFKTPAFWLLIAIFTSISFCLYGLLPHIVPMLTDRGMDPSQAALAASTVGMTIMAARIIIGYLIDRFFAPRVAMIFFLLSAVGIGILATGTTSTLVFFAMVLIGFSFGAEIDLMAFMASRYFGLRHFGEIYGLLFASLLIGTSLGPAIFGFAYESFGSYIAILLFSCVLNTAGSLLTNLLPGYPDLATITEEAEHI